MTQHQRILKILTDKGQEGMNSYKYRMEFIQLPARICSFLITHNKDMEDGNKPTNIG